MRSTTHGERLVQLTRFPLTFPINCYLVREDDGLTLIDTGMSSMEKGIVAAARRLDAPITRIALTHAHGDHAGSLDALRELLPDAEVLVGAREARLLAGDHSLDPDEPQAPVRGGFPTVTTPPIVEYASPAISVRSRVSRNATWPGEWPGAATTSSEPTRSPGANVRVGRVRAPR